MKSQSPTGNSIFSEIKLVEAEKFIDALRTVQKQKKSADRICKVFKDFL
jgi:hypothetical protein